MQQLKDQITNWFPSSEHRNLKSAPSYTHTHYIPLIHVSVCNEIMSLFFPCFRKSFSIPYMQNWRAPLESCNVMFIDFYDNTIKENYNNNNYMQFQTVQLLIITLKLIRQNYFSQYSKLKNNFRPHLLWRCTKHSEPLH